MVILDMSKIYRDALNAIVKKLFMTTLRLDFAKDNNLLASRLVGEEDYRL